MALCSASSSSWNPDTDPKLMLITSAPNVAESSIAATISSLNAYLPPGPLEKAFIASNCVSGATP